MAPLPGVPGRGEKESAAYFGRHTHAGLRRTVSPTGASNSKPTWDHRPWAALLSRRECGRRRE